MTKVRVRDEEIRDEVGEDIDLVAINPQLIGAQVEDGVVRLTGHVERRSDADILIDLITRIEGVVRIESTLDYEIDDGEVLQRRPVEPAIRASRYPRWPV